MTNKEIAQLLQNVAAAYIIKNQNKYRFQIIAYERAADAVENSTTEVTELAKEGKLASLPGLGVSISGHLEELVKTGKVKHFDWVFKDIPEAMFPLLKISGFGPKRAYRLVTEFKLKNPKTVMEDIENLAKNGKIAQLKGFGEKSQSDLVRAIVEYKKGVGKAVRMNLPFAAELASKIISYLKESKEVSEAYTLGSLRRMAPTIGDIDIAVATDNPNAVIKYFVSYPQTERIIEQGPTTASILVSGGRQIDLMTQPKKGFGALLQHFTGSKNHNVHLREYALQKGLSLSEYGIKTKIKGKEELKKYDSEEEFYKTLGMDWIPPELREDTGEIEAAIEHKLPKLIELGDIKGDLHIHSSYPIEPSHDLGHDEMKEMLKKARELGYEYLGFAEHNPSISKHTEKDIVALLAKRKESIEHIKSDIKNVRIINLLEVDIQPDGRLCLNDRALEYVDAVIASVHSSFSMTKSEMTERIIKGLSHPKAKILGHPTGRLIGNRDGYDIDFEKIFDFCKKHNKALEINAWPTRLDLPDIIVREAVKKDIKIVIDTDSHAIWQMDLMKFGVSVARRGWAEKKNILNTLPYNELISWIRD